MQKNIGAVVRWLASLRLTIVLAIVLAAMLAGAIYLEAAKGLEWAQWYVYGSGWYAGLLGLLAANIAAATLNRCPWRWRHPTLVLAPIGLLVLLIGFLQTSVQRTEGQLLLRKGGTASSVHLTHRSQLTLLTRHQDEAQSTELGFSPGPADWRSDEPLDFGRVNGMGIKVLRFFRHARLQTEWVANEAGFGQPAIQVAVSDGRGSGSKERWCVPVLFRSPAAAGETAVSIHRAFARSLLEDFLHPPAVQPSTRGLLSVHCGNRVYPIPVDGNLGKKVPVGESGLAVEIVEYYANSVVEKGQYRSRGDEPKNPMLRLQVYPPGKEQPITEVAYANLPFVNLASMRNQNCPADFWYHHPAATAFAGAEFLQTPDGKLHCRVGTDGKYQSRGEVKPGDRISVSADCQVTLLQYLPWARKVESFAPVALAAGQKSDAEAAAQVELEMAGRIERFWLRRNDAPLGIRKFGTPSGPLVIMFGYEKSPLGFSVKLVDFRRDSKAEPAGSASCVSQVQLSEGAKDSEGVSANNPVRRISTHSPLRYGAFTIYQAGFRPLSNRGDVSVLRVTSDPGRLLKYLGGAMVVCGILYLLCLRVLDRR